MRTPRSKSFCSLLSPCVQLDVCATGPCEHSTRWGSRVSGRPHQTDIRDVGSFGQKQQVTEVSRTRPPLPLLMLVWGGHSCPPPLPLLVWVGHSCPTPLPLQGAACTVLP